MAVLFAVLDGRLDGLLQRGVQHVRRKLARGIQVGFDHLPPHGLPHELGQKDWVSGCAGGFAQRLQNGHGVANRNPLAKQILKHALHRCQREQFGDQVLYGFGMLG